MGQPNHRPLSQQTAEIAAQLQPHQDLSAASVEELVGLLRHVAGYRSTLQIIAGRIVHELVGRQCTLRSLADQTGVPKSTLDRWSAPFKEERA